jgi:tRNA pseudouridine55 synthase
VSEYLMNGTKRYRGVVRFGATSNTDDAAGIITPTGRAVDLDLETLRAALPRFVGEIRQVPPAFAAIKVGGQPAYKQARAGLDPGLAARTVRIGAIDPVACDPPDLTLEVTCSKGTYIRALARDLGEAVGAGGYLRALTRLGSGAFTLEESLTLDEAAQATTEGYLGRLLYPLDAALLDWPAAVLDPSEIRLVRQGRAWAGPPDEPGRLVRAYDSAAATLVAILRCHGASGQWQPEKVFPQETDDV